MLDTPSSVPPNRAGRQILRLARVTTPLWLLTVGLFSLTSYLDADRAADLAHIVQIYALGFLPWLILAPVTVFIGIGQARRQPGWPRLAIETVALALVITAIVLANMATIVATYWGVSPAEMLATNSFREWIWDILIFIVALLSGHMLGARQQPDEAQGGDTPKIVIRSALRVDIVDIADVVAASAQGNYVALRTEQGEYLHRATLGEMQERLAPHGFVQLHRSHLVRTAAIVSVRRGRTPHVLMPGGHEIPVSASGRGILDQLLVTEQAVA